MTRVRNSVPMVVCWAVLSLWFAFSAAADEPARALQQQWAERLGREVVETNSLGMKLVLIPPGAFLMGSDVAEIEALVKTTYSPNRVVMFRSEGPQHRVEISQPFYLGQTSVTVGQFRRFVEATGYRTDAERKGTGGFGMIGRKWRADPQYLWNQRPDFDQTDEHPVVNVSWHDAVAFCNWLSQADGSAVGEPTTSCRLGTYRLPTEAEWEYACRAGTTTRWHTGDDPESIMAAAWLRDNADWHTQPVGQLQSNAFCLFDMMGNARNWCSDGHAADYYSRSPRVDPPGAEDDKRRIVRGSCFHAGADFSRSAMRYADPPEHRMGQLGFRVVCEVE